MKKHQAIICSYCKDFPWLPHCLRSLRLFAKDFLPPVVCVDQQDEAAAWAIIQDSYPEAKIVVTGTRPRQGFMRAQIAMMSADLHCPEADVIYFIGSDCLAWAPFSAKIYCDEQEKPVVFYSHYDQMNLAHPGVLPWREGVRRVLGIWPEHEYMRRLPSVFPREVFPAMRAFVERRHGMRFDDYIYSADANQLAKSLPRDTSEANILGAYAYYRMHNSCHWVDIGASGINGSPVDNWPSYLAQFWSHGGLDRPAETCVDIPGFGSTAGRTPREVIAHVLYNGNLELKP